MEPNAGSPMSYKHASAPAVTAIDTATRVSITDYLMRSAEVTRRVAQTCGDAIAAAACRITSAFSEGGKLLLCGNGGSAAECQHMAAELLSRLARDRDRPPLPAIALTTDTSFLTAFANDVGFEGVFERQVQALGRRGDVLIAISTSGDSENCVRAVAAARAGGLVTIALTGAAGRLSAMVDVVIAVPSDSTQHVQEAHLAIEHLLCELVERRIFPRVEASR